MVGNGVRVDRDQQIAAGTVIEPKGGATSRAALAAMSRPVRPQARRAA
jgi:hypothetical protein